jgi:hypothetical protein
VATATARGLLGRPRHGIPQSSGRSACSSKVPEASVKRTMPYQSSVPARQRTLVLEVSRGCHAPATDRCAPRLLLDEPVVEPLSQQPKAEKSRNGTTMESSCPARATEPMTSATIAMVRVQSRGAGVGGRGDQRGMPVSRVSRGPLCPAGRGTVTLSVVGGVA